MEAYFYVSGINLFIGLRSSGGSEWNDLSPMSEEANLIHSPAVIVRRDLHLSRRVSCGIHVK